MQDVLDIIKNVESIYDSNTSFNVLKDFERVLDELDIYVYKNWKDGELAIGPNIERHWVTCSFMWDAENMPDPMGGKRLLDYDCKVTFKKSHVIEPRKIEKPDDIRPGTKKGKLDRKPIWIVEIQMPKKLIADIYTGYVEAAFIDPTQAPNIPQNADAEPAEDAAAALPAEAAPEEAAV
tara:strand:+ start:96 stop:632 length:537 start_codon:yes stop_codon:yes gene_type:complete